KGESSEPKPGAGRGKKAVEASDLGTSFIPNSPDATAERMAGAEASAKAKAELGGNKKSDAADEGKEKFPNPHDGGPGPDEDEGDSQGKADGPGKPQKPGDGKVIAKSSDGGGSKKGEPRINEELKKGAPQFAGDPGEPGDGRAPNNGPRDTEATARAA